MSEQMPPRCPHCNAPLIAGQLACPACNHLVFEQRIGELLENAQRLQEIDPMFAAGLLRQAMALVPPGSEPHRMLAARVQMLASHAFGGQGSSDTPPVLNYAPAEARNDNWGTALLKTGGSMALSIAIYQRSFGWVFAVGFVMLILIHELGHVLANAYYGLKQSPPIFIPYMGAVIWLRQTPPSAKAEAIVGIAGPIAGTLGALACYFLGMKLGNIQYEFLARVALGMNLFNLIPCPPLDGGRVAAAMTPFLWIPGVLAFVGAIFYFSGARVDWVTILMALWILQSALPRLRAVLLRGGRHAPYFHLLFGERALVTTTYTLLTLLLASLIWWPYFMRRWF